MRNLKNNLHLCSINTATLGFQHNIYKTADTVAQYGFGGIAPWIQDIMEQDVKKVAKHLQYTGLRLSGYCRSPYIPASTTAQFQANLDANKRCIDDAVTLHSPAFIFVVGSIPDGSGLSIHTARKQVSEGMAELADHAKDMPIQLALEPLHPMYAGDRSCVNTLSQAYEICQQIDPNPTSTPKISVAVDVYHCWWDPNLYDHIATLGADNRICAFHVSDWLTPTTDFLMDRGMMGDGVINIAKIRHAIENTGYTDLIEVEIFSHTWRKHSTKHILSVCANRLQTVC